MRVASRRAGNLPSDLSSFVGRAQDAREVRDLLAHARLLSIIGPSGVGKSRFALRVGTQVQRSFRDGVWLVELAAVSDAALVTEVVAGALQVPEKSGREPAEALCHYLAQRQLLMILDNCEQLRDACAAVLSMALRRAPGLRVLATSQEVLGLPGEAVYRLNPLAVPGPDGGVEGAEVFPAVALFTDRAASAMHGFTMTRDNVEAVVELCRRLDGLPLAIELAAARARVLSPSEMLHRMDDRFRLLARKHGAVPPRHQSLKAAMEWSYDLCGKPERLVWQRLSVFPSSFDLPAAEAVCTGDGLAAAEVADAIGELVDRSVLISEIHPMGTRYRLLESIREFGLRMLRDAHDSEHAVPENVLRSRHLDWYAGLAADFDADWFGPRQHDWLERLRADLPNIRAALSFAMEDAARREDGLSMAGNLCFFWRVSAMREGGSWLIRLLGASTEPSPGRARAMVALAWLSAALGQPEGISVAAEALSMAERFAPTLVPRALSTRGALMNAGDVAKAKNVLHRALAEAERTGSVADRAFVLYGLGWSMGVAGEVAGAERHFRGSLAVSQAAGDLWYRGAVQLRRALVHWLHDDQQKMASAAADALRASRLVPDTLTCANALVIIAASAVARDDRLAATLFGAAEHFWEDAGGSVFVTEPWRALLEDSEARCRAAIGIDVFEDNYQRGKEQPLGDAIAHALGERPQDSTQHPATPDFGLTRRELEVLELISQGLSNKEIANRLISPRTAETHVQNILIKTGYASRTQLAAWHSTRRHETT